MSTTEEQRYMEKLKRKARRRKISLDVILEEERVHNEAESQGKKYCYDCKLILDKSCFGKLKIAKDGLNTTCTKCRKNASIKYYHNNSSEIYEKKKEYLKKNKRKILDRQLKYVKKRKKEDPIFKLSITLRTRIRNFMRCKGTSKMISKSIAEIVGCSPTELKEHIEKQFVDGMSWENHGPNGWHLDHIIPLISAKTEEEMFKLNHYTNLQPLWSTDNLKKGKKYYSLILNIIMEELIREFLIAKYSEPLVIKALPYNHVVELYLRSGKNLLAYGLVRKGQMYEYIDWDVPTLTLNEVNPYFDINILECQEIMLGWLKDKFAEQGYNIQNTNIIEQLIKEV